MSITRPITRSITRSITRGITTDIIQRYFTLLDAAYSQYYLFDDPWVATGTFDNTIYWYRKDHPTLTLTRLLGKSSDTADTLYAYNSDVNRISVAIAGVSYHFVDALADAPVNKFVTLRYIRNASNELALFVNGVSKGVASSATGTHTLDVAGQGNNFAYASGVLANIGLNNLADDNRFYAVDEDLSLSSVVVDSISGNNATAVNITGSELFTKEGADWVNQYWPNLLKSAIATVGGEYSSSGSPTLTPLSLNYLGLYDGVLVASSGAVWHRITTALTNRPILTAGESYTVTGLFKIGTSGEVRLQVRQPVGVVETVCSGDASTFSKVLENAGSISSFGIDDLTGGYYKAWFSFTAGADDIYEVGLGPNSTVVGEDITALALQTEKGLVPSEIVPTNGIAGRILEIA